jgi:hypothetical protein
MKSLEYLVLQLSDYIGKLQVQQHKLKPDSVEFKEIKAALQEVRDNLEWCLTLKPELDENGCLKNK